MAAGAVGMVGLGVMGRNLALNMAGQKGTGVWTSQSALDLGAKTGFGGPCLGASLAYLDTCRRERLPANLIDAQRDDFGAQGYRRVDRPWDQKFHSDW